MPTHAETNFFRRDFKKLTGPQRARFAAALRAFIEDLLEMESGRRSEFRPGLGVRRVAGTRNVFEMRWAPDGRATFHWGDEQIPGLRHIYWRRCGTHDIFKNP